jgi:dCMP deaminase
MIGGDDKMWLECTEMEASLSEDPSRKSGCLLVSRNGQLIEEGHNCFPFCVEVTAERMQRPAKYAFTEHAERNAIYNAAKFGASTNGATAYLNWYPCADCARALVQVGVVRLVCYEPDWNEVRYGFEAARQILAEGDVRVEFVGQKNEVAR